MPKVNLTTNFGVIGIELDQEHAPWTIRRSAWQRDEKGGRTGRQETPERSPSARVHGLSTVPGRLARKHCVRGGA